MPGGSGWLKSDVLKNALEMLQQNILPLILLNKEWLDMAQKLRQAMAALRNLVAGNLGFLDSFLAIAQFLDLCMKLAALFDKTRRAEHFKGQLLNAGVGYASRLTGLVRV